MMKRAGEGKNNGTPPYAHSVEGNAAGKKKVISPRGQRRVLWNGQDSDATRKGVGDGKASEGE